MSIGYVKSLNIVQPGTGYSIARDVYTTSENGTNLTIDITRVGDFGEIVSFKINNRGCNYNKLDAVTIIQDGSNNDAILNIDDATISYEFIYIDSVKGMCLGHASKKRLTQFESISSFLEQYPQPCIEYCHADLPRHIQLKSAWDILDNNVVINIDTAKQIYLKQLRYERDLQLLETDKYMIEAVSQHKNTDYIQNRKQYLRDLPKHVERIDNVDDLLRIEIEHWEAPDIKNLKTSKYIKTDVIDDVYTIKDTDEIISISRKSPTTLILPEISTIGQVKYIIKDRSGNARIHNITIIASGKNTIDGNATYVIDTNYGCVCICSDEHSWFIISQF